MWAPSSVIVRLSLSLVSVSIVEINNIRLPNLFEHDFHVTINASLVTLRNEQDLYRADGIITHKLLNA